MTNPLRARSGSAEPVQPLLRQGERDHWKVQERRAASVADDALSRGRWDAMTVVEQFDYVVGLERALVERDRYRKALEEICDAYMPEAAWRIARKSLSSGTREALGG